MLEKPIRLYLAILNEGWIRAEHINTVFTASNTKNVHLVLETLGLTWDKPISSNRNRIVQRFLKSDCDFLMMIDDDVVPFFNVGELISYDVDVIGAPTRRRKEQRLEWVVYSRNPSGEGYYAVDLDKIDPNVDLLGVDAIGTGCILIKRKVLETVKHPFEDIFDKDGVRIRGMDLNFCDKAKAAGFKIFVSPKKICEHFRDVGLVTLDAQFISHAQEEPMMKYGLTWGHIVEKDWDFIKDIIQKEKLKTVLEFGTDLSTLLMSEIASVDSFDVDSKKSKEIKDKIPNGRDVRFYNWDGMIVKPKKEKYDLVFIDGPRNIPKKGEGKEIAVKVAVEYSDRIILHNAGKMYETMLQEQFLQKDFSLISRNGWHQMKCHYWKRKEKRRSNQEIFDEQHLGVIRRKDAIQKKGQNSLQKS